MEYLYRLYDYWARIPRWQKWIVIAIIGALVFASYYFLRVIPLKKTLEAERKEVQSMSTIITELKAIERKKADLGKIIRNLEKEIEKTRAKLPSGEEDVSDIIKSISSKSGGVNILSIERGAPVDKQYYIETPYTVEMETTYPDFLRWCEKLSQTSRIFNFGDITLTSATPSGKSSAGKTTAGKKSKKNPKAYTLHVKLQIKAFSLKR